MTIMKPEELNKGITALNGSQVMLSVDTPLTYRSAIISVCEIYKGEPGSGDTLRAYNLGVKFINDKNEVKLGKEEVDFLKKIVENNQMFMAIVVGRLIDFINKFN